ncbi:MAG: site-specific DNA-methyltransferase [Candidatus Eremiobacteraeota bacterium]|nr:site-specific DNA-methyltransferase [Candidatus Eremiobacteraeota bacterium]MBC5805920.1 site-specific DNA-methyltransferase [Candidatus Eremiobacteraeota bacterium]MBC5823451.1 site-specific DNA-methyltransferase [Candidatus Eremiobacteraeota bacterium]
MEIQAAALGLQSISEYVRWLHSQHHEERHDSGFAHVDADGGGAARWTKPKAFHRTASGAMYLGDSRALMLETLPPESVDLAMTSPPFGLVRKKSYGNEDADEYLRWFRPFAQGLQRVLKPRGSAVIDIGGAWKPGMPARSLYHFELVVMLCREFGFYLCQEHFWWNPAKLPTPAEWVNIRRVRVKDSVNTVWWISKTPWPKASNRRVLAPYSEAMEALLRYGYKTMVRPSGHSISKNFSKRNAGAVPPNLIAAANTESNGRYQAYCKERGITPHPARFPASLPEYFIRMLTDKGDTVLDPFAGSCVTGEVAEALGRRWIGCELDGNYLRGALGRFETTPKLSRLSKPYTVYPPATLATDDEGEALPLDGGSERMSVSARVAQTPKPAKKSAKVATNGVRAVAAGV